MSARDTGHSATEGRTGARIHPRALGAVLILAALVLLVIGRLAVYRNEMADRTPEKTTPETTASVEPTGSIEPTATIAYVRVVADGLKLRRGPSRSAEVLRELRAEESLAFIAQDGDWYHVTDTSGLEGWVAAGAQYSVKIDL